MAISRSRVPDIPDTAAIREELKQVRQHLERLMSKFLLAEESKCLVSEELDEGRGGPLSALIDNSHSLPTAVDVYPRNHCFSASHNNH